MSNPYISGIKKDLVPRVIMGGSGLYLGFVHESAKNHLGITIFYGVLENVKNMNIILMKGVTSYIN